MTSRLRFQRERRGWSRATLAEVLGTTSAIVAQWEEGFSIPPLPLQEKLRVLFGLDDQTFKGIFPRINATQNEDLAFLLLPQTAPALPVPASVASQKENQIFCLIRFCLHHLGIETA